MVVQALVAGVPGVTHEHCRPAIGEEVRTGPGVKPVAVEPELQLVTGETGAAV